MEMDANRILPTLARQVVEACSATSCEFYRPSPVAVDAFQLIAAVPEMPPADSPDTELHDLWLREACERNSAYGFSNSPASQQREILPLSAGIFAPLAVDGVCLGAVHIGARTDRKPFNRPQERMILALINHAALAIARQTLSAEASQAQALRQSDELKTTLLSLVSHELRTPLASIKASASGLLTDRGGWDQALLKETLESIEGEADRLNDLVSKLLDLSRLDAGIWRPVSDWCDLLDVIGASLARLSERDSQRIQVDVLPETPLVRADFVQIAQVMTNLLENAIKYTPPASPVTIALYVEKDYLRIDVADAGSGIPADKSDAIFERFQRLECHMRGSLPGTGLGLAICREIIIAHGGRIWEHNAPSGGAIFSFTLPLARDAAALLDIDTDVSEASGAKEMVNASRAHPSG